MRKLLEELFAMYYQDVYRYLYGLSRDASLAEELASEVFLEAVKSIALFRGEADIKTWLFAIARHRWFGHLRRREKEGFPQELPEELMAPGKPLEEQFYDKALAERIRELLDAEPERTKGIVLMRLEGYAFREIGKKLGISENSARVIDFRARAKIRQILKEEGWDYA